MISFIKLFTPEWMWTLSFFKQLSVFSSVVLKHQTTHRWQRFSVLFVSELFLIISSIDNCSLRFIKSAKYLVSCGWRYCNPRAEMFCHRIKAITVDLLWPFSVRGQQMPLRITEELDSLTVRVKGQGFVQTQIYLHSFFFRLS